MFNSITGSQFRSRNQERPPQPASISKIPQSQQSHHFAVSNSSVAPSASPYNLDIQAQHIGPRLSSKFTDTNLGRYDRAMRKTVQTEADSRPWMRHSVELQKQQKQMKQSMLSGDRKPQDVQGLLKIYNLQQNISPRTNGLGPSQELMRKTLASIPLKSLGAIISAKENPMSPANRNTQRPPPPRPLSPAGPISPHAAPNAAPSDSPLL